MESLVTRQFPLAGACHQGSLAHATQFDDHLAYRFARALCAAVEDWAVLHATRHCEARSDEAIDAETWIASLRSQ
jgi:hypothetical protein